MRVAGTSLLIAAVVVVAQIENRSGGSVEAGRVEIDATALVVALPLAGGDDGVYVVVYGPRPSAGCCSRAAAACLPRSRRNSRRSFAQAWSPPSPERA